MPPASPPLLGADPVVAQIVRPLVLQFFVLALLWYGTGGMGRIGFFLPGRRGAAGPEEGFSNARGNAAAEPHFAVEPGRVLLPFLMIATGILFFSAPLAPLWRPALPLLSGVGGGIPAGGALATVLALNLGVLLFLVAASGGIRRSALLPLLLAFPVVVGGVGGAGGALVAVAGAGGGLGWLAWRVDGGAGQGWPWRALPPGGERRTGVGVGALGLVALAYLLGGG